MTGIDCDEAPAMRGGLDPDRCWFVYLEALPNRLATAESIVVLTTDGDLVAARETVSR